MEEEWYADRARLRTLMQQHPDWSHPEFARQLRRSVGWVKKWRKRLAAAPPDDAPVRWSQPNRRRSAPVVFDPAVVRRILEIRDTPPDNLQRTPGPKAILS